MTQAGRRVALAALALILAAAVAGCGGQDGTPAAAAAAPPAVVALPADTVASEQGAFRVRELVRGLVHPWSLAFLPDGRLLVSERPGRLRRIDLQAGTVSAPLDGLPRMFVRGQGGLLDIALSPAFEEDHLLYFAWSEPNWRGNLAGTTVSRARLEGDALGPPALVVRQEPMLSAGSHFGARLVFTGDGLLYVALGDNRTSASAQSLDHLQGKVLRLRPDGSVPADNPFAGRADARPEIWSYGHRNIQGMALHPVTGVPWTHEHGPRGGDEINVPVRGGNHGWPLSTHGLEYSGAPVPEALAVAPQGLVEPLHWWPESPAVSGMAFHGGGVLPAWRGNLFVGALAGRALLRLVLEDDRVVHEERLLVGRGERIRDVREGPDGLLYLLTDEVDGRLLRLEPATD